MLTVSCDTAKNLARADRLEAQHGTVGDVPMQTNDTAGQKPTDDRTDACPECDSSDVEPRVRMTPPYRCKQCDAEFHQPARRDVHSQSLPGCDTLARDLIDADPDALGGDE